MPEEIVAGFGWSDSPRQRHLDRGECDAGSHAGIAAAIVVVFLRDQA
jgi:hypothetical protein